MWLAMTGLMMAPVVYPWLRALNRVAVAASAGPHPPSAVAPFLGGYMLAWAGFGAAAAGVHVSLAAMAFPVPFRLEAPALSAAALMLTGAYQLTPLKGACLSHCRSPAGFLLSKWRDGPVGQTRMGFEHGLYCLGCCWALMALALVVGMGSLAWMGVLMAVMVVETALPFGGRLARPVGAALIVAGVVVAATGGPA